MEWIKNKLILILVGLLVLSVVGNIVFSVVIFKNGLKVIRNTYTTNNNQSNSYASSGSLVINIMGVQFNYNGKYVIRRKQVQNIDDLLNHFNSVDIGTYEMIKIIEGVTSYYIFYPEFVTKTSERVGKITTIKEENK